MAYVALSRVKELSGLTLVDLAYRKAARANEAVKRFMSERFDRFK